MNPGPKVNLKNVYKLNWSYPTPPTTKANKKC